MSGELSGLHRECFQANFKRERSHSIYTERGSPTSPYSTAGHRGSAYDATNTEASVAEAPAEADAPTHSPHTPLFELIPLSGHACTAPAEKLRFGVEGIRVGRDPNCSDVVINSTSVSRLHCVLSVLGDEVFVHDNSFNGTFINGRRVGRGRCSVLHPRDTISFMNPTCTEAGVHSYEFAPLAGAASSRYQTIEGMQRYELGPVVGQGSFAAVRLATDRETGEAVAVKLIERRRLCSDEAAESLHVEIEMMRGMDHPNIVRVLDAFEGGGCVALVMEYVRGGDLFDYVVGRGRNPFTEAEARHLFVQLLEAILYIHGRSIIHCDLKPENVLVGYKSKDADHAGSPSPPPQNASTAGPTVMQPAAEPHHIDAMLSALDNHQGEAKALSPFDVQLKLTDFGVAKYAGGAGEEAGAEAGGGGGTAVYAAPELAYILPSMDLEDDSVDGSTADASCSTSVKVTSAVDIWSLGVLLYILCSGTVPKQPLPGSQVVLSRCMHELSASCTDLITRMMVADPTERITLSSICHHPWLDGVELRGGARCGGDGDDDRDALSVTTMVSPRFYRPAKAAGAARARRATAKAKHAAEDGRRASHPSPS